ncbi:hypothetical protein SeLEV6574_g05337 [Synchytrium endobioticum]|uniref:Uncharacterized protein n=1 Tax=Synchytrium endobioticum TaxID=286115 RepID=A0A507CUS3_9FUNG|nr:hypothetical protein SeLEV6574_g05337 [Synchytrium endobioticum]
MFIEDEVSANRSINMARKERECRYVYCESRKGPDQRNCPSKKADGEAAGQKISAASPTVMKRKSVKSADVKDSAAIRPCAAQTWIQMFPTVATAAASNFTALSEDEPRIYMTLLPGETWEGLRVQIDRHISNTAKYKAMLDEKSSVKKATEEAIRKGVQTEGGTSKRIPFTDDEVKEIRRCWLEYGR